MSELSPYWKDIAKRLEATYQDPILATKYLMRQAKGQDIFGFGPIEDQVTLPTHELTDPWREDPSYLAPPSPALSRRSISPKWHLQKIVRP